MPCSEWFDTAKQNDIHEECSICLGFVEQKNVINCGHFFCDDCIASWQKISCTCPLCRKIIKNYTNFDKFIAILLFFLMTFYLLFAIPIILMCICGTFFRETNPKKYLKQLDSIPSLYSELFEILLFYKN